MHDYFLHSECGYQYTPNGRVGELTQQESADLFRGYYLWKKHIENPEADKDEAGGSREAQRERFEEFAADVNG